MFKKYNPQHAISKPQQLSEAGRNAMEREMNEKMDRIEEAYVDAAIRAVNRARANVIKSFRLRSY